MSQSNGDSVQCNLALLKHLQRDGGPTSDYR